MSGLLSTTCARPRIARRASCGVSPSYVKTPMSPPPSAPTSSRHLMQFGELILRERLRRKQIQRARRRILQDALEDRRVVAERLARRRRRDDDDVAPAERVRRSPRPDACRAGRSRAHASACSSRGSIAPGNGAYARLGRRQPPDRGDVRIVRVGRRGNPEFGRADERQVAVPRPPAHPCRAPGRPLVLREHARQRRLKRLILVRRRRGQRSHCRGSYRSRDRRSSGETTVQGENGASTRGRLRLRRGRARRRPRRRSGR